ncbi:hypothetical protein GCM10009624_19370 [Gordonia sinesedis]
MTQHSLGRRAAIAAAMMTTILAMMVTVIATTSTATAETPAERCARETAAYNAAWAQSWATANGRPASEAPPPPVPYVCRDPGTPTSPTTTPPVVTAPTLPTDTNTPEEPGPNVGAHAPTDIPAPGQSPIVPVPGSRGPEVADGRGQDDRRPSGGRRTPAPQVPSLLESQRHDADKDYPVNEILETYTDKCGNEVILRRGYWNSDANAGRGWDKIYHYHNMRNKDVIRDTVQSQCGTKDSADGKTLVYRKTFFVKTCKLTNPWVVVCEDQMDPPPVTFRLVVQTGGNDRMPDGKSVGVVTGYCELRGTTQCPSWLSNINQITELNGSPWGGDRNQMPGGDGPVA